jgi:DNA repair exonuclease SbcCD ATPase subunit
MGQRLLVVDSDRRFIQDQHTALESTFEVDILNSTDGALIRLESGQYAAVLLCVEVSENKGYSLCSAIRRAPALAGVKIALISAKATEEEYARHQSLKGRADLYLHKPIHANELVSALSPFVPMKVEDPDNPLGDLGGGIDLGDEWLESLRSELEVEAVPRTGFALAPAPAPAPTTGFVLPPLLPLSHQATQKLPSIPKDAGRVELLEARVADLEAKLVAKADQFEHSVQELADLRYQHQSVTRNLDELEQRQADGERLRAELEENRRTLANLETHTAQQSEALREQAQTAHAEQQRLQEEVQAALAGQQALQEEVQAALAGQQALQEEVQAALAGQQALQEQVQAALAGQQRLQEDLQEALAEQQRLQEREGAANASLAEKEQQAMDTMESNQLLQAQLEEAKELRDQLHQAERLAQEAQERAARMEADHEQQAAQVRDLLERCEQQEAAGLALEAERDGHASARMAMEGAHAELEQRLAAMAASHELQQHELLTGIDDREAQLGRLQASLDAQRERLSTLEQQKADLENQVMADSGRMMAINDLLTDLEGRAREALNLTRSVSG